MPSQRYQVILTFLLILYMRLSFEIRADIFCMCTCNGSEHVNCSNLNLTSVPKYFLPNVKYINLYGNKISKIGKESFVNLHKLEILRLSNNRISNIELIENLPSLVLLDLSYNDITIIKKKTFKNLCSLQELYLSNNKISIIEQRSFENLERLRTLFLYNNKISNIERESFENLPELADLDLTGNEIFKIDQNSFVNVTRLEYLHLSHNKISNIEESTFKTLGSLKDLGLSYNQISNIEEIAFKNLHSLRYLDLSYNQISIIKESTFKTLHSLRDLDLSFNNISNIEESAFKNLGNLQELDLSHNQLSKIKESTFKTLHSLRDLDLSHNNISTIKQGTFENLYSLQSLYLGHNQMQKYEDGAFLFLPDIYHVDLSGNKDMMCGCHLLAVVNYTRNTYNTSVVVKGECHTGLGQETTPILKYSQCQNYSLFQKNLECQTCSGMMCNDSERTGCPGVEPVCQYKLSMNGVTLKFERSCRTYRNCLEAMRNNTFTCNKWANGTSCVACCSGNQCNKNDFMGTVEEFSRKLLNISQKSVDFKEDIVSAIAMLEEMALLISNAFVNIILRKILHGINDMINAPEKILVEAEKANRTVSR
ncbi:chaoptin isoform X4 [Octopus bimaculoides]|uniref:chaoptin isoform X4 n=1 Tax=Octopus bimaculoides TaxID=37653 RepID=UPI0022E6DAB6|nr:chaoptin isoform X4 [Octopus bimaculoides]